VRVRYRIPDTGFRLILAGMILSLGACSKELLTEDQLKKYVMDEEHGVRKVIQSGDFKLDVLLRPTDLLVLQELKSTDADSTALLRLRKKYEGQYYFILNISKNGREVVTPGQLPGEDFSEVLQTVSFRLGNYVTMTTEKQDTIPLVDFVFNRTFGMGAGSEVLLVFDKKKIQHPDWLQINLTEMGLGLGLQTLRFRHNDLEAVPSLNFTPYLRK
jgi:hypothetical protein